MLTFWYASLNRMSGTKILVERGVGIGGAESRASRPPPPIAVNSFRWRSGTDASPRAGWERIPPKRRAEYSFYPEELRGKRSIADFDPGRVRREHGLRRPRPGRRRGRPPTDAGCAPQVFYTAWPVILLGTFDQDVSAATALANPALYAAGPADAFFARGIFFAWVFEGLFEALLAVYVPALARQPRRAVPPRTAQGGGFRRGAKRGPMTARGRGGRLARRRSTRRSRRATPTAATQASGRSAQLPSR